MPRKSIVELQNDLATSFPDNTTGLITPAILRAYIDNFLLAIRPSYAALNRVGPTVQALTAVNQPLVFDTSFFSGAPDYTASPGTGVVNRLEAGVSQLLFNVAIDGPVNTPVIFEVYKNGVFYNWRTFATLQGPGKLVNASIAAIVFDGAGVAYQLMVRSDGNVNVTFHNTSVTYQTLFVNAY